MLFNTDIMKQLQFDKHLISHLAPDSLVSAVLLSLFVSLAVLQSERLEDTRPGTRVSEMREI